jgi:hypothetical protein
MPSVRRRAVMAGAVLAGTVSVLHGLRTQVTPAFLTRMTGLKSRMSRSVQTCQVSSGRASAASMPVSRW